MAETTVPVTTKVNTSGHHPDVESLTRAVVEDFVAVREALSKLLRHSQQLAEHDQTHGRRVYEAVQGLNGRLDAVHRRVAEMREHVDDDTP
jgi:hypothetical protein